MTDATLDPFDPANLRLGQSFTEGTAVKKLLNTVPVRKPNRQEFVRVHPDLDYRLSPIGILELKEEREMYLVAPDVAHEVTAEMALSTLYTAMTRQGVLLIWPVRLPAPDGRRNEWHRSADEAAAQAMRGWVRVKSNMALGAYEVDLAIANIPEPEWPELTMREILRIAFRDRHITDVNHPVLLKLRGAM